MAAKRNKYGRFSKRGRSRTKFRMPQNSMTFAFIGLGLYLWWQGKQKADQVKAIVEAKIAQAGTGF